VKLAALLGACLLVGGCAAEVEPPAVDVDTAELRAQKSQAGIEDCEPGQEAPYDGKDALPAITLPCLGGGPEVRLDELRGPLVINLFAQWCGPCREELPLYQRLHEQGGRDVRVLGIDWNDTQPGAALALAEETGVTFPLLADASGALTPEFRIRGLPGIVFMDESGAMATEAQFTVIRDYEQLTDLVRKHLGVAL